MALFCPLSPDSFAGLYIRITEPVRRKRFGGQGEGTVLARGLAQKPPRPAYRPLRTIFRVLTNSVTNGIDLRFLSLHSVVRHCDSIAMNSARRADALPLARASLQPRLFEQRLLRHAEFRFALWLAEAFTLESAVVVQAHWASRFLFSRDMA